MNLLSILKATFYCSEDVIVTYMSRGRYVVFFALLFLSKLSEAQTSRLPAPKGFTINLSKIDKNGFSKDKFGRALKKESKLLYFDSLNTLRKEIKGNKAKLDSLERLKSNPSALFSSYMSKEVSKFVKNDSSLSTIKLKTIDSIAYVKNKFDTLSAIKAPVDQYKSYVSTDSSSIAALKDSVAKTESGKLFSAKSRKLKITQDSLSVSQDSIYGAELKRQAYNDLLKEELKKQGKKLEAELYKMEDLGFFQQEQVGFDKISKELESTQKKIESIRKYDSFKEGVEDNQEVLLKELGGDDSNILKSTQEILSLNQKSAFSKLSNILGINKYNNPYSLKSDSLNKRIKLGGNLQVVQFENPIIIDFSPRVGFRMNKIFTAGVELNYRAAFGSIDTLKSKAKVPETMFGYRLYLNGFITKGFFGHIEFESMRVAENEADKITTETIFDWKSGWLIGIGKQYRLASKVNGSITLLYSINNNKNKLYTNPFQLRFGFDIK